ncbi:MAG: ATP-binding protein [Brevundimonas sp.]|uniref:sensor histidine kinase n=1 Tax=Brevundimonas sp. TaxID=1871086 RepID=UPI0030012ECE
MTLSRLSEKTQWRLFAAVWVILGVLAIAVAGWLARLDAEAATRDQARTAAVLHAAVLTSELERQQAVPSVLAADPELLALVTAPSAERRDRLNLKLEQLAEEVRAAALYVLAADGTAMAASNWREPTSFVGSNYRFRPYYIEAMRDGEAAFFALGTVSGRPGLYLARRIDRPDGTPAGVIVAKVEFGALEQTWRSAGEPTYVTDADGVVLITTTPEWRFRTTRSLSDTRRRQLAEEQTTGEPLEDMPFTPPESGLLRVDRDGASRLYAHETDTSMGLGWTLHLLWPADQMMTRAVGAARILAGLSIALLAGLTGILLRRRQRARNRAVEEEAARAELERQVALRTAELSAANQALSHEMEERRSLELSRQVLEDELVQANKLATVGQIAAGVAHEINQPIAAIRTHADTAGVYLERGDRDAALRSLTSISGLTERVGTITDELRAFSRKTRSEVVAVDVEEAIEGALLLVSARLRERGIWLDRSALSPGLKVKAERNRLEQVVLNLLQNSIEALDGTATPTVALSSKRVGRKVVIRLTDNGPGLPEDVRDRLFTPFVTSKASGLGLGLVISRDIVAGFGGELTHESAPAGTVFQIVLAHAS